MKDRIRRIAPALLIGLAVLGLTVWYMMSHPAPAHAPTTAEVPATPTKISEDATYYTVDAAYPPETPLKARLGAQADQAAVALMKAYVEGQIAEFKKNGNFDNLSHDDVQMMQLDQRKYAIGIEYDIFTSARTVSYVYQIYEDTGGAHPNTFFHTFTFDLQTGTALSTADLFDTGAPYAQTLSSLSRAKLPAIIAERENVAPSELEQDSMMLDGTKPEAASFENFYFDGANLVLVFPPYQVGPYVLGRVDLPLKTSEVPGLRSEYVN